MTVSTLRFLLLFFRRVVQHYCVLKHTAMGHLPRHGHFTDSGYIGLNGHIRATGIVLGMRAALSRDYLRPFFSFAVTYSTRYTD